MNYLTREGVVALVAKIKHALSLKLDKTEIDDYTTDELDAVWDSTESSVAEDYLSNIYTKSEVDSGLLSKLDKAEITDYEVEELETAWNDSESSVAEQYLSNIYTRSEMDSELLNKLDKDEISDYADDELEEVWDAVESSVAESYLGNIYTKSEIDEKLSNIDVDLTGYATKEEFDTNAAFVNEMAEYVSALPTKRDVDVCVTRTEISAYPTKQEVQEQIGAIEIPELNFTNTSKTANVSISNKSGFFQFKVPKSHVEIFTFVIRAELSDGSADCASIVIDKGYKDSESTSSMRTMMPFELNELSMTFGAYDSVDDMLLRVSIDSASQNLSSIRYKQI